MGVPGRGNECSSSVCALAGLCRDVVSGEGGLGAGQGPSCSISEQSSIRMAQKSVLLSVGGLEGGGGGGGGGRGRGGEREGRGRGGEGGRDKGREGGRKRESSAVLYIPTL